MRRPWSARPVGIIDGLTLRIFEPAIPPKPRLAGVDAAFWFGEIPTWHTHGSGLAICDPSEAPDFSFEAVRDLVASRLPEIPQLRYRVTGTPLGLDRPWFVEDADLDLDFHIRHIRLPRPGGRDQLYELVERLLSHSSTAVSRCGSCGTSKGLEDGRVAILTKMHHAVIDGMSGAGLSHVLFDVTAVPRPPAVEVDRSLVGVDIPRFERRALAGSAFAGPTTACAEPHKWNEAGYHACVDQLNQDLKDNKLTQDQYIELVQGCCSLSGGSWNNTLKQCEAPAAQPAQQQPGQAPRPGVATQTLEPVPPPVTRVPLDEITATTEPAPEG